VTLVDEDEQFQRLGLGLLISDYWAKDVFVSLYAAAHCDFTYCAV